MSPKESSVRFWPKKSMFGALMPPAPAVNVTLLELEKSNVVGVELVRLIVVAVAVNESQPKGWPPPTMAMFKVLVAFKTKEPLLSGGFGNLLPSMLMLESDSTSTFVAVITPDPARKSPPENDLNSDAAVMSPFTWTVPSESRCTTSAPEIGLARVRLEPVPRA